MLNLLSHPGAPFHISLYSNMEITVGMEMSDPKGSQLWEMTKVGYYKVRSSFSKVSPAETWRMDGVGGGREIRLGKSYRMETKKLNILLGNKTVNIRVD